MRHFSEFNSGSYMGKTIFIILLLIIANYGQDIRTPQSFGAHMAQVKKVHLLQEDKPVQLDKKSTTILQSANNTKTGQTFKAVPFDEEKHINQFTKKSANIYLDRDLFNDPEYTASYYYSGYDKNSVEVEDTYIQFVSDGRWNRVLYGSLQGVIKSYDDIKNPGEIAVNSAGQVFIVEKNKSRIQVLKINGKGENINLNLQYIIDKPGAISSIAYNDAGTPFNINDDFLCIADASSNTISKFSIGKNSAQKETEYKGFEWPVAITFGHTNGTNNNELYVVDSYAKRLTEYRIDGNELTKMSEVKAGLNRIFTAVETDHFGQVYVADGVRGELFKLTSDLHLLDSQKTPDNSISDINIPFGTVNQDGEKYWVGFDQLFILQKWNDQNGMQRYKLGIAVNSFNISVTENNENINTNIVLTEFANDVLRVFDNKDNLIYESSKTTIPSGENNLSWNRVNQKNQQVAPGYYKMSFELQSVYDESIISREKNFYLPLYYHIRCGNEDDTPAIHKISGTANVYNGQNVLESMDKVEYRISGLNPASEYKIAAQFLNIAGEERIQEIIVDGFSLDNSFEVTESNSKTAFMKLPAKVYADGEIDVQLRRVGAGSVNVSDIWLTESGQDFSVIDPENIKPASFKLLQNYPNPFNPETTIRYELPVNSDVIIKIYDLNGRKVQTLVNGYQNAGRYSVVFNGSHMASGIYFYQIKTNSFSQSRKMILLK